MNTEPIQLHDVALTEACSPAPQSDGNATPAEDSACSAPTGSDSDSDADDDDDDEFDLGQLDGLAAQDTEEALEHLKKWVCSRSKKLSLSSQDREIFARLTDKYFSDLKIMRRELEARSQQAPQAGPGPSSHLGSIETDAVQMSSKPPSRTPSKAASENSASSVHGSSRVPSEISTSSFGPDPPPVTVEGSDSSIEVSPVRRQLLFPEHSALFGDDTEEKQVLLDTLQRYLSEDRDYFHSINLLSLFRVFKYLLLYHLESEYDSEISRGSPSLSRSIDTLVFYKRLFDANLAPHMFRQVYEKLTMMQTHLQISDISDRITHQDSYHDIFMLNGLLSECFQVYQSRTGLANGLERMNFRCPAVCSLCLLDEQLVVVRVCCGQSVCYNCFSEWVRTKVFTRTVEVGCPCCSCYLTVNEIVDFLGDKAERYYEILTDLNGDPNKKTCPQCNLITTKNPNMKANKRLGGELTHCLRCEFNWCFRCHSPPHPNQSCSANTSGKQMLRDWGLETYFDGSQFIRKARKCPSCKVYIEKNQGCNHMTCNRCNYQFCYVCGKNWRAGNVIFGRHSSRLSIFGCKQKLFPNRPALRKLVRGTLFVLETTGIVIAVPIALALVIGLSPILAAIGLGVAIYKCKH